MTFEKHEIPTGTANQKTTDGLEEPTEQTGVAAPGRETATTRGRSAWMKSFLARHERHDEAPRPGMKTEG